MPIQEKDQKGSAKLGKVLTHIPEIVLIVILTLTMIDMVVSVFTRYVTGRAIYWAEEVGTFGLVWITMIGGAVAVKRRAHFTMPTFVTRLPARAQYFIDLVNHALIMAFGFVLALTGYYVTSQSLNMASPALEVNLGIMNSAAVVCGVLILIYEVGQVLQTIRTGAAPPPEGH